MAELGRLGIDWGKARIGVAASNPRTSFAYPVETVRANGSELKRLKELVGEYEPELIYVGLPLTLSGQRSFCRGGFSPAARMSGPGYSSGAASRARLATSRWLKLSG